MASWTRPLALGRQYLTSLTPARAALWCYLLWYLVVLVHYFDPSPRLWLTSLGLSAIIGVALVLNAGLTSSGQRPDRWQVFRFFMMPFCVSSFASMVKDRGFVLVFSPRWGEVVLGAGVCLVFLGVVGLAQGGARTRARRRHRSDDNDWISAGESARL